MPASQRTINAPQNDLHFFSVRFLIVLQQHMNYLAHLYLSGESKELQIGNFIADFVKGKNYQSYPEEIAQGILLHRKIDSFTDEHPLHREARTFFRGPYQKYAGIVVDFVYDHFLAANWEDYSPHPLRTFTQSVHANLLRNFLHLPQGVQVFLPFLIQNKRLESYATTEGILNALNIKGKHSSLPQNKEATRHILIRNYDELEQNFRTFFEELMQHVREQGIALPTPIKTTP